MTKPTCSIDGCEKDTKAHGWCQMHYTRWIRHGDPVGPRREDQFWARVDRSGDCWSWLGRIDRLGYGRVGVKGKMMMVHRYAWTLSGGELPAGMVIDHLCHNRACVRPEHLRVVTQAQNSQNRNGAPRNSKTGIRGVTYNTASGKYIARFWVGGKDFYCGAYPTTAEAEVAVVEGRRMYMTHSEMDKVAI